MLFKEVKQVKAQIKNELRMPAVSKTEPEWARISKLTDGIKHKIPGCGED